jgi:hypothetical protein
VADVDLEDVLKAWTLAATDEVYTAMGGRVLAYDAETRRARVRGLAGIRYRDADGSVQFDDPPIIAAVPVLFPGFAGRRITWPVLEGDDGVLVLLDRSHDEYQSTGEPGNPASPRRHNFTDAVFLPFDLSPGASDEHAGGAIVVTGDDIRLGSKDASDAVALAPTTLANDEEVADALISVGTIAGTANTQLGTAATVSEVITALSPLLAAMKATWPLLTVSDPAASKVTAE